VDKVLNCGIISIPLSGSSTTPGATFAWIASGGGHILSGANTATPTVDAAGTYTMTVTDPANGCTATDIALVEKIECDEFCTYTQGFYGSQNGTACDLEVSTRGDIYLLPTFSSMEETW